jgi:hypothetical protein
VAGSPSSLVVTISADITDFSKQLDAMTKGVDKAARQLELVGDVLKVAITEKVIEAGAKFLEMGASSEAAAARMQRAFGSAANDMKASIDKMTSSVPETAADLENLATHLENVVEGMGLAPGNAAQMSKALLQVAADAAAVAHVPIGEALDALSHGLAGRGRELTQFGLAFNQAEVKERAMTLGLLAQGNQLTDTGTALASYSLIMERATRLNGAAAAAVTDADRQVEFFKRDIKALGDQLATVFLPTLLSVVNGGRSLVDAFSKIPTPVYATAGAVVAVVAVLIPLGIGITKIIKAFVELRAAFTLLSAGGSILGFFAALTTPIGWVIAGTIALTAAVLGLVAAYERLRGAAPAQNAATDKSVLDNDPGLAAHVAAFAGPGQNQPTQLNPKDAFQQLQEQASIVAKAFDSAVSHGEGLMTINARVNSLYAEAVKLLASQGGQLTKNAGIAAAVADQMQRIRDIQAVANAPTTAAAQGILNQIANRPIDVGASGAISAVDAANKYRQDLATRSAASQYQTPFNVQQEAVIQSRGQVQSVGNDLALRQSLLALPDGFNAAALAAVQYGEAQRQTQEETALAFETIKIKLGPFGSALDGLSLGMQNAVVTIYNSVLAFAQQLVSTIGGSGAAASKGRGIGAFLGGAAGGILGFFLGGPAGATLGASIGGTVGTGIGGAIGGAFDHNSKSVNDNATAMDNLSKTVNAVTASISNIPQFFKIESYRYAAAPIPIPGVSPSNPPSSPTGVGGTTGPYNSPLGYGSSDIHVAGNLVVQAGDAKSARDLYEMIKREALKDRGTNSVSALAFAGGF